jgi:putative DNA primase/helicase
VLYRAPELIAAPPESVVYIVEGEKDVDAAYALGVVATCNPDGGSKKQSGNRNTGKWKQEFNQFPSSPLRRRNS